MSLIAEPVRDDKRRMYEDALKEVETIAVEHELQVSNRGNGQGDGCKEVADCQYSHDSSTHDGDYDGIPIQVQELCGVAGDRVRSSAPLVENPHPKSCGGMHAGCLASSFTLTYRCVR